MSVKVAELVAELHGDDSHLDRTMRDAKPKYTKRATEMGDEGGRALAKETSRHVSSIDWKGALLAGGALVAAGAYAGKVVFDAFSDRQEADSKVGVVFDDMAADIRAWASTSATAMGISTTEALGAAGTFGNLFRAMEIGTPQAGEMSKRLVGLAADLGSFNNANPEDVLLALRSGLTGETEPLRQFGVNINEARIKAEAFRLGLVKADVDLVKVEKSHIDVTKAQLDYTDAVKKHGAGSIEAKSAANRIEKAQQDVEKALEGSNVELTAAEKAQASYSLILADTSLAQGDFARTAGSAANEQRSLAAKLDDTKVKLGEALEPLGNFALDTAMSALDGLNAWWDEKGPGIKTWITDTFGSDPAASFRDGMGQVQTTLSDINTWIVDNIGTWEDFGEAVDKWENAFGLVGEKAQTAWEKLTQIGDWMRDNVGTSNDFWNGMTSIGGFVDGVEEKLGDALHFDTGGVVPGPIGAPRLIVAHGGETVLPTHKNGGVIPEDDPRWRASTMGNRTGWEDNKWYRDGVRDTGPEWDAVRGFAGDGVGRAAGVSMGSTKHKGPNGVTNSITINVQGVPDAQGYQRLANNIDRVTRGMAPV